ncbi:MAG: FKBP-type peptidyl-prolyl cis-trans isomerase [candidate division KSB1 bacterium]|nr:FKBP-type peptidyl-prolyl cis-trans isomerase [candidate division KSB1 bacterium]MDZ7368673.1 FKBP-type peptidyl-prolyl cis-trans isomerase [candidate division KSB1 bacterium]MDZ7406488.1 FKBP-type peptidyl-prolyl cis-trans isomerase [candidate division KSB1 bacterium]
MSPKMAVLLLLWLVLSCSRHEKSSAPTSQKLTTTREKFSYALGYDFGPNMEHIKSGVDLQFFMRGLEDYLNKKEALVPMEERQRLRAEEFTRIGDEYIAQQKEEAQKRLQAGEAFLAENQKQPGVVTTASGLQYLVLTEGHGRQPGLNDRVKIKYRGAFIDGTEFVSTERFSGKPSTLLVRSGIPGWVEGFQLMRTGSSYRFFLHPRLAYGEIGQKPDIPPNATLIYDVELVEIMTDEE